MEKSKLALNDGTSIGNNDKLFNHSSYNEEHTKNILIAVNGKILGV